MLAQRRIFNRVLIQAEPHVPVQDTAVAFRDISFRLINLAQPFMFFLINDLSQLTPLGIKKSSTAELAPKTFNGSKSKKERLTQ